MKLIILFTIALLLAMGCASVQLYEDQCRACIGQQESCVRKGWGEPALESKAPGGQKVLTYHKRDDRPLAGGTKLESYCNTLWWIDETGMVVSYKYDGNLCVAGSKPKPEEPTDE